MQHNRESMSATLLVYMPCEVFKRLYCVQEQDNMMLDG